MTLSSRQPLKCSSDTYEIALHLYFQGKPQPLGCRSRHRYSSSHSLPTLPAGIGRAFSFGYWRRWRRRRRWESWKWFPKCGWEGFFNPICASRVLVSNQSGGVAQGPWLWRRSAEKGSITPVPNYTSLFQRTYTQANLAFATLSPNPIPPQAVSLFWQWFRVGRIVWVINRHRGLLSCCKQSRLWAPAPS